MTVKDWDKAQTAIEYSYSGICRFMIDGYKVTLLRIAVNPYKREIAVYVNGKIKGEWIMCKTDEAKEICRRFYCPKKVNIVKMPKGKVSKAERKSIEELATKYNYTSYDPYWTSFNRLKSHLMKNNKDISLIEEEKYDKENQ